MNSHNVSEAFSQAELLRTYLLNPLTSTTCLIYLTYPLTFERLCNMTFYRFAIVTIFVFMACFEIGVFWTTTIISTQQFRVKLKGFLQRPFDPSVSIRIKLNLFIFGFDLTCIWKFKKVEFFNQITVECLLAKLEIFVMVISEKSFIRLIGMQDLNMIDQFKILLRQYYHRAIQPVRNWFHRFGWLVEPEQPASQKFYEAFLPAEVVVVPSDLFPGLENELNKDQVRQQLLAGIFQVFVVCFYFIRIYTSIAKIKFYFKGNLGPKLVVFMFSPGPMFIY